uniref:Uncharacterized protein n=1 Tax=Ascaris lumbricoides TaxID=6252 RepID=A0A0M3HNE6_ASCLU
MPEECLEATRWPAGWRRECLTIREKSASRETHHQGTPSAAVRIELRAVPITRSPPQTKSNGRAASAEI